MLRHGAGAAVTVPRPATTNETRQLADAIANGRSANHILDLLTRDREHKPEIGTELTLNGRALDAAQNDWDSHAWRYGAGIQTDQPDFEGSRIATAVVPYSTPEPGTPAELTRGDVALAARTFARAATCRTAAVVAYQANADGVVDRARGRRPLPGPHGHDAGI